MVHNHLGDSLVAWGSLLSWLFTHALGKVVGVQDYRERSRSWMDEWLLAKLTLSALRELGLDPGAADWAVGSAKILISHQSWFVLESPNVAELGRGAPKMAKPRLDAPAGTGTPKVAELELGAPKAYQILVRWLRDSQVQQFLQINRHRGVLWFNKEAFDQLLAWMLTLAVVEISADRSRSPKEITQAILASHEIIRTLQEAALSSEYQVAKLLDVLQE
jgi:hypothetical protein